jgi:protein-L-isoaspartate(D-aspartate) O-methyltransferase
MIEKENKQDNKGAVRNRNFIQREEMVKHQIAARGVSDKKVLDAMLRVPRDIFVPAAAVFSAYEDRPLSIGHGQTISQPYIVALMTECLGLKGNEKILEIGTGSGYQTAILAEIADEVYSIEIIKPLYERAKKLLSGYKNVRIANSDGYNGWKKFAPYDRIILTAAPETIPEPLIEQLKDDGIMVLPSGPSGWSQSLLKIRKIKGEIKTQKICDVAFVPLTRNH